MRLICGFYHRDGQPAEKSRLEKMIAAMIEPGLAPQVAQWVEGPVALAVLDFALSTPFEIARGGSGMVLAADCRLDEPDARGGADEAVLLDTLQRRGAAGVAGILGDFVCASWNPQTRTLLCARDGMGIRPLFMNKNAGKDFAFASLPRALHAGGFATRQVDESYMASELLSVHPGFGQSLFSDISRLAPGSLLQVAPDGIRSEIFWKLGPELAGSRRCSPQEAAEELSALLTEAVHCRLPKYGPVAAHLSGGLDSSAITILAARMLRSESRPLLAYSFLAQPQEDGESEHAYVEAVLRQEAGIDWTAVAVTDPEAFLMPQMDCDQLFPSDIAHHDIRVCADAGGRGADMLLSGWGGDEGATYNGRGALAEALLGGRWPYVAQELAALRRTRQFSIAKLVRGELLQYLLPVALQNSLRDLLGKKIRYVPADVELLLRPEFAAAAGGHTVAMGANATLNHYHLLSSVYLAWRAEQWALMGSRYGLAVGFPMLDRRVVEFALSLPGSLFLRGGWKRRVYRDAMLGVLPDEIRWRHHKLVPAAETFGVVAARREWLLPRLDELRSHPRIDSLFDLEAAGKILRSKPSSIEIAALLRVLRAAEYIRQHH
jgi:asparagine synthase (glutamine-hydrolysing)